MKFSSILGINSRTVDFSYKVNTARGKKTADSKIHTDRILTAACLPHPEIFRKFRAPRDIAAFDWTSLPDKFALKPSRGMGGEGIIVVKKRLEPGCWLTTQRTKVTIEDLKLHSLDILEGAYSMGNVPDAAFIQEFVGRHEVFRKYAFRGTPDIRIIVFNKVPVMAMLRLPTRESGGRANLHQGAIGVGVDIATGITTKAIWHGKQIYLKPGTKRKLRGIKIPYWNTSLLTAAKVQEISGLGYCGVDIVLHPDKGPMVLELNAQPGLQIQMANMTGLKKRLERVEDLEVRDTDHGVKIAKALFAERFLDRVKAEEGIKILNFLEQVKIVDLEGNKFETPAKIDTGAWRTSIDRELAGNLGLLQRRNILWTQNVRSSLGKENRHVINLKFYLAGRPIKAIASLADRSQMKTKIIVGRQDLGGFLVRSDSP